MANTFAFDGYPLDFGEAGSFQLYDVSVEKTYESQKKIINVAVDMTVEIIMH